MKYILYPILTITIVLTGLCIVAPLKFIWHLVWHFEIISFRQATKDLFVIDNPIDIKQTIKDMFIYNKENWK